MLVERAFEFIDHTADTGIIAYGMDIKQLFANAGLGLFSLITDAASIEDKLQRHIEIRGSDTENLLVEWLNELIYLFDGEHFLFSHFEITALNDVHLRATCYGEPFNPLKHSIKTGVKAATYHMLKITTGDNGYRVQVIFDV